VAGRVSEVRRMRFEFGNADFIRNRIRQRAVVQDATSAMNKQIGGMEPLIYSEGKELTPLPDFIQIKIHIVRRPTKAGVQNPGERECNTIVSHGRSSW